VDRVVAYGESGSEGFIGSGATTGCKLQGSNDNSSWTDLWTGTCPAGGASPSVDSNATGTWIDRSTAWRYHRFNIQGNGTNGVNCAEAQFYSPGATNNVSVASTALSAASAPATMKVVALVKFIDSMTLGTDFIVEVSRNGGTDWSAATMTDRFTAATPVAGLHVLEGSDVSVTAQASGTSAKWRVRSANNKSFELHGVYLRWS
ncbi:MAG: hypothetical protein JO254_05510, partial [Pseudolabrys sp.]|nr:hypothetical protein [Pseudolabrys sp.]